MPPLQHKVQVGDTVSSIAKRFNVPTTSVSGFRSNDPATIFPDEILNINQDQTIPGQEKVIPALPTGGGVQPPLAPVPQPLPEGQNAPVSSVQQPQLVQPPINAPEQLGQPEIPTADQDVNQAFTTPSGLTGTEDQLANGEGEVINTPEDKFFGQFGTDTNSLQEGFSTNPSGTLSDLINQVMQVTGLPDIRSEITSQADEIEAVENERDAEIAKIGDDPFRSNSSKNSAIRGIEKEYELKLKNKINRLTLLQGGYDDARQQAQFAATTAINLFSKERDRQLETIQDQLDKAEKVAEAEAKLNEPLSVSEAKSLGVPFGTTRKEGFGVTSPTPESKPKLITLTEIKKYGLPKELIGKTTAELDEQLQSDTPPNWFVSLKSKEVSVPFQGGLSQQELKTAWIDFVNQVIAPTGSSGFNFDEF